MSSPAAPRTALRVALQRAVRVALLPVLLLAACASLPPLPDSPVNPYRLDTGDEIRVITFGEEHLTGQFRVNDSGNIAVPLLGLVKARGVTVAQLQDAIAAELKARKLIVSPSVSVEVTQFRPIYVLGEVSKPGQYPYQPGMSVLTAVALAGGFTYRAVRDQADISRIINGAAREGVVSRNAPVHPGDVITIEERWF